MTFILSLIIKEKFSELNYMGGEILNSTFLTHNYVHWEETVSEQPL